MLPKLLSTIKCTISQHPHTPLPQPPPSITPLPHPNLHHPPLQTPNPPLHPGPLFPSPRPHPSLPVSDGGAPLGPVPRAVRGHAPCPAPPGGPKIAAGRAHAAGGPGAGGSHCARPRGQRYCSGGPAPEETGLGGCILPLPALALPSALLATPANGVAASPSLALSLIFPSPIRCLSDSGSPAPLPGSCPGLHTSWRHLPPL